MRPVRDCMIRSSQGFFLLLFFTFSLSPNNDFQRAGTYCLEYCSSMAMVLSLGVVYPNSAAC